MAMSDASPEALSSDQAAALGFGADLTSGLLTVPVNATPDDVYAWLEVRHAACLSVWVALDAANF